MTSPNHVLVPLDDSDCAMEALTYALEEERTGRITAIHVTDPGELYTTTPVEDGIVADAEKGRERHERRAETILEPARRQAEDRDVEVETTHVVGEVSRAIVDYADEHDVDRIVVGSHGRTGTSRVLLGSVAETVARRAPVPVTIVR